MNQQCWVRIIYFCDLSSLDKLQSLNSSFKNYCDIAINQKLKENFNPYQILTGMKELFELKFGFKHPPNSVCGNVCICGMYSEDWFSFDKINTLKESGWGKKQLKHKSLPWYCVPKNFKRKIDNSGVATLT